MYTNQFRCVPRALNHPPPRPERRIQQGLETATVVGPAGEEIFTDEYERVKVQFHWDREGARDEHSSCWLRLVQPWSGMQYGAQFIPRIGTEVVVGFIGGDTDRPVVMGSLYNGAHTPPFELPAAKTRSGIRTASTPGGDGHNELSFEDAAGSEEVHLRAQRDLREVVLNDRTTDVGANVTVSVGANSVETIGGDSVQAVRGSRSTTVIADAVDHVLGERRDTVEGNRLEVANADVEVIVANTLTTRVGGVDERVVQGEGRTLVVGDQNAQVRGCATLQVGQVDAQRSYAVHVEGYADVTGTRVASLNSDEEVVLRCGRSSIRLTPDAIELVAPRVLLSAEGAAAALGDERVRFRAKDDMTVVAGAVVLRGESASLGLDREARLGGDKVRLGAKDSSDDLDEVKERTPTRIELVDQDGNPLAYQRFKVLFADGSTRVGLLDKNGAALVDLDDDAEILFDEQRQVRAG